MAASKTKILKGLKYFSHMFEEEKEDEIQIGLPTDVKHVAHIGWDGGPSTDAPSWMKDFKSAPLAPQPAEEQPDVQWVSEDTKTKRAQKAASKENPDSSDPPKAKSRDPSKPRQQRRHQSSDSNDVSSTSRSLPDVPRKARRKKSKDADGSSRPRSKASSASHGGDSGSEAAPALPPADPKTTNDHNAEDRKLE